MVSETVQRKRSALLLAGILVIFLMGAALMLVRYYFILPDSTYLLSLGKNIAIGNGLTINNGAHFRYPPAYAVFAGLIYLVIGNLEAAGHVASVVSGLGAIVLVYVYTARVYDRKTGLIAALILALIPLFVWICSAALAEGFYALAYAGFILTLLILMKRPVWWLALVSGIIVGIAYLTRAEGFLLLPLGFIILLVSWWRGKHRVLPSSVALAFFIAGWLLLAFPYMLFLRENLGGWTLSGKITQNIERVSEAIYIGDYESLRDDPLAEHESPGLVPYIIGNFPRVMERYVGFTLEALRKVVLNALPVLVLFVWFLILALGDKTTRGLHFLLFASPLVVYPLAHIEIRYLTPTLVAIVPLLAWGMKRAWDPLRETDRYLKYRRALILLTIAMLVAGNGIHISRMPPPPIEHRILADWMRENLPDSSDARIAARFPYVSFYLGNEDFRYLPRADTLDESLELARERELDYLVIDERVTPEVRPALESLLDPANAPDGIDLIVELNPPEVPFRILLYRIQTF